MILRTSLGVTLRGRPSLVPLDLALARPARTRSWIIARSNSLNTPSIWNMARPAGVDVSRPCWCKENAYQRALEALIPGTREWWLETLEEWAEEPEPEYEASVESLTGWLEEEAIPYFGKREAELANRELIREHALGEALAAKAFEDLARYEVHLDRKLERTLAMLIKLQDLRRTSEPN